MSSLGNRRTKQAPPDARPTSLREQAERHAEQARQKTEKRRERLSGGLQGWLSDRAGEWSLEDPDFESLERQKYFWNPLMDYWFRMEIEGWERLPGPPALLVGVHSGAPLPWDAWTVGLQWWRRFGDERILHGTAHDMAMAAPLLGRFCRKLGVLPATPDSILAALAAGRDVALWPGGELDALRRWTERDKATLVGRSGFVRLAIRAGAPIVPIATVGGADAMPILTTGRRLAGALRLRKLVRFEKLPLGLSVPWGIAPAVLPHIPLPAKIRTAFQDPVELDHDPERATDGDYVRAKYEEVERSIQRGMDALARRRRLPILG
jgi:1-acyl-sn-glycerol-3-phosphate acyltransferase